MNLYLDVETIPDMHPQAKDEIRASIKPPGTYKKAESIATWYASEAEGAIEEAWRKQALDGGTRGQIISIAVCDDSDRQWVRCIQPGESEAEVLTQFFDAIEAWTQADAQAMLPGRSENFPIDDHHPVAHNASFDLGFLWRRATVKWVHRPRWLPGPMARPGRDFSCTMQEWAGFGQRISLDSLCRALGVTSPKADGLDGSKILDAWLAGQYKEIERYNLADSLAVREIYHRVMGWPGSRTAA